ncbi:MAG: transcription elongation factor GreA [Chloroflexi bacterium]|nr:transcription elongation factor GreA [Chloroflexota bacterium]
MSAPRSAVALLRSLDLLPDGPVRWGERVRSSSPGVLLVEVPARLDVAPIDITVVQAWLERVPGLRLDGERPKPTELADRLASFWLPQQTVAYVGRSSKSIGGRAASLSGTLLGDRRPHTGGHWLWTLRNVAELRIWWAETDAPEEYEDAIAAAIAEDADEETRARLALAGTVLPWANLTSAAGEAKTTGITSAQLADGETAPAPVAGRVVPGASASGATSSATSRSTGRGSTSRTGSRTTTGRGTAGRASSTSRSAPARVTQPPAGARPAVQLTASGLAAMQQELHELTTVRRPEVILRVKHARELGDLRENADYEAARNEQAFLEGRIRELEQTLRTAVVIQTVDPGTIALGSRVDVEVEGLATTLHIVGSSEADPASGRVSDVSPVGKALMGHRAGDHVVIQAPGRQIHYRVVDVGVS